MPGPETEVHNTCCVRSDWCCAQFKCHFRASGTERILLVVAVDLGTCMDFVRRRLLLATADDRQLLELDARYQPAIEM